MPAAPDASWEVSKEIADMGRALLDTAGLAGRPFAAVHLASFAHAAKRWELSRFADLLDRLAACQGLAAVLLGSAGEGGVNAEASARTRRATLFDLSGKSSLPEVLGILSLARLFVGNDSGIGHLAAAVGTPTVTVFGPTDPDATRPWDGPRGDGKPVRVAIARRRTVCAPCRFDVCPLDHRCMSGLDVESVLRAVASVR